MLGLPRWIFWLLLGFLAIKFLLAWYVPANDIDSVSSYMVRNYFSQFGPLEKTATFEFLYTFPTTFDFMFGPFLKLHWFETLPNFLLFVLMLYILFRQAPPSQHVTIFALVFSCQALITQISSGKNDLAIATFALTCWWAIYCLKGRWFRIPLALFAMAALLGTKWMGIPLAGLLFIAFAYEAYQDGEIKRVLLIMLALLPLLLWVGSINTYLTNWVTYGSPIWTSPAVKSDLMGHESVWQTSILLFQVLVIKSFDMIYYLSDRFIVKGYLWKYMMNFPPNIRYYVTPAADYTNVGGIVAVICAGLSVWCLFLKNLERPLKVSAALGLIYTAVMIYKIEMNPFFVRYLSAAYVLMILPAAYMVSRIEKPYLRRFLLGFALFTMIPTLFMQRETLMWPVPEEYWVPKSETDHSNPGQFSRLLTIFEVASRHMNPPVTPYPYWPPHKPDRDALQFMIWLGLVWSYDYFRAEIPTTDSLMMVNFDTDMHGPVAIGPFLRLRNPANTLMVNVRNGDKYGDWHDNLGHVQYVMAWDGPFSDPRYCLVHSHRPYLTIFRLKDGNNECPKPYFLN